MEKVVEDSASASRTPRTARLRQGVLAGGAAAAHCRCSTSSRRSTRRHREPVGRRADLTKLGLIPADGIMLLAAHVSRHGTMTEWMDASIVDESDRPSGIRNWTCTTRTTQQPPYTPEFLARYREAQIARNRESPSGSKRNSPNSGRRTARRRVRIRRARHHGRPRWWTGGSIQRTHPEPAIWVILRW